MIIGTDPVDIQISQITCQSRKSGRNGRYLHVHSYPVVVSAKFKVSKQADNWSARSSWLMNPATSYLMEITNFKPQENIDKDIVQLFGPACYSVDIAL